MNRNRPYRPLFTRPHTYGVRHLPCGLLATEPCRPTACAGEHPHPAARPATAHYSLLTANSSYTFSAKERDSETGLSYFGSRYYSSDLSIWLSVDPMAGKYPSLSPYVYCADNPVKLVDPNGEEVWIGGEDWELAFSSLQKGTNLELSIEKGVVSIVGGKVLNDNDQQLFDAINDNRVIVFIMASKNRPNPDGGDPLDTSSGHCYGASYSDGLGKSMATNYVNVNGLSKLEKPGAEGSGMMHEVTEAYGMGCISLREKKGLGIPFRTEYILARNDNTTVRREIRGPDYGTYLYCHKKATPAPNEMNDVQSRHYKNPSLEYTLPLNIQKLQYR